MQIMRKWWQHGSGQVRNSKYKMNTEEILHVKSQPVSDILKTLDITKVGKIKYDIKVVPMVSITEF